MNSVHRIADEGATRRPHLARRDTRTLLFEFGSMIATLWRRKLMIVTWAIVAGVTVGVLTLSMPNVYRAATDLLLETRGGQVINIDNIVDNPAVTDNLIVSEIAVIRSRPVFIEVAEQLDLARHAEFNPALTPPSVVSGAISAVRRAVRALVFPVGGGGGGETARTPAEIAADILFSKVAVDQIGTSYVIRIEVESESPHRAAAIADAIAQTHLRRQVDRKLEVNQQAVTWLSQREAEIRRQVESSESLVNDRRAELMRRGIATADTIEAQKATLSTELIRAEVEAELTGARAARFDALVAERALTAASRIASSEKLEALIERRDNAMAQNESRRELGLPADPALDAALARLDAAVDEEARELSNGLSALAQIARSHADSLEAKLNNLEATLIEQAESLVALRAIERETEARRGVYERFLNRLTETRERGAFQQADARVVAPAVAPQRPIEPRRTLLVMISLVVGGALASLAVLAADAGRETLRTEDEAQDTVGAPVLAALPQQRGRHNGAAAYATPAAPVRQAARRLAMLLAPERPAGVAARTVFVGQALPGDGAPEVAALLAQQIARDGQKVVVMECGVDPRSPLRALAPEDGELQRPAGLDFDVARLPQDAEERATVLGAVLERLRGAYDVVIVAAPPILEAPAVLRALSGADGAVLAFRWEKTSRDALREAMVDLLRFGLTVDGLVMTEVDTRAMALYAFFGSPASRSAIRTGAEA